MHQTSFITEQKSIDEAFEEFHAANPHVLQAILSLCRQRKAAGHKHWSMQAVFSILRHAQDFQTTGSNVPNIGKVKLSDHYTALYARKLMSQYPEFDSFFELRRRPSAD